MRHLRQLSYVDAVARAGSIRRAAETLSISSTALNRRILAIEEDLGVPIFERLSNGVRLSTAGELFIQHVRQQLTDVERIKSQIADLSGVRRGHVSVVCGQALLQEFLPKLVAEYRHAHPGVTFSVRVSGHRQAADQLLDFSADVALIYQPEITTGIHIVSEKVQPLYAVMNKDHPLVAASRVRAATGNQAAALTHVRLADCAQFPLALPTRRSGVRDAIEQAAARRSIELNMAIESDNTAFLLRCLHSEPMISFQIPVALQGLVGDSTLQFLPIHVRDVPLGSLLVMQQSGRTLPVAAARFVSQVVNELENTIATV